jgi:hypothetical protein
MRSNPLCLEIFIIHNLTYRILDLASLVVLGEATLYMSSLSGGLLVLSSLGAKL